MPKNGSNHVNTYKICFYYYGILPHGFVDLVSDEFKILNKRSTKSSLILDIVHHLHDMHIYLH